MTIKGLEPSDERLHRALPYGAASRQIAALDQKPTEPFRFFSPVDGEAGEIELNRLQVESISDTLRDLGVAPDSFAWTPHADGPFPGLRALQEGDEALFFGRDLEIRDGLREIEALGDSVSERALLIQAPSGAGKSSFLRAGLWRRLRRHAAFTPLGVIRTAKGALYNEEWGLIAELSREAANHLGWPLHKIEEHARADLPGLLLAIADADASPEEGRRTLLLGVDQGEEIAQLTEKEHSELAQILDALAAAEDSAPPSRRKTPPTSSPNAACA